MRPHRLELAGFTTFRDPVAIDFDGVDLFALVGPTGAGKTSIIDGMCMALYGTVPRLDRRLVAPVISAGLLEARVRFDFTVGERAFTAVRVVRRTKTGATTREARLESSGHVLAGDADAVTRAVTSLLGLGFEQFSKCVVLPQGEFARFLHDKPSDRQDLLVRLLELDVYERMREAANVRRKVAEQQAALLTSELERLADVTEEALAEADARIAELTALRAAVDSGQERLAALTREAEQAGAEEAAAAARAAALAAIAVPDDVGSLAAALTGAQDWLAAAQRTAADAEAAVAAAETALAGLPPRADLERHAGLHADARTLAARVGNGRGKVAEAVAAVTAAREALDAVESETAAAEQALERMRRAHTAATLRATLRPGEECPVCSQLVTDVPHEAPPETLTAAEEAAHDCRRRLDAARAQRAEADTTRARFEEALAGLEDQHRRIRSQLAGHPGPDELARVLDDVLAAEATLAARRQQDVAARAAQRRAQEQVERTRTRGTQAWHAFDRARDAVAALGPPPADRENLAGSWDALTAWAAERGPGERETAAKASVRVAELRDEARELADDLRARCAAAGVDLGEGSPQDACADALAGWRARRDRLAGDIARSDELRAQVQAQRDAEAVAAQLHRHLAADGFERWLLEEALDRLAQGASGILEDLSAGAYSLTVDEQRNFVVIDHRNAAERRSARTLSGGETFLASLSLALSLAEHLTEMAVATTPRLESIFLDEGFGTLDPETLDVVAAAIEELGARGRTVGLVTHVRELAERVPVRYEVRKTAGGSAVERVVA